MCLISDCLFENHKEPFKTYMKKYPLPKLMFVSEYTGMQHVNRHVDREAVFGSVIVAMSDSGEQLTMWPGGMRTLHVAWAVPETALKQEG